MNLILQDRCKISSTLPSTRKATSDMADSNPAAQTDAAALTSTIRAVDGVQDTVLVPSLDLTQTVDGRTRPIDVLSIDTAAIAPVVHSTEEFEGLDDNALIVGALHDIPDGAAVTLTGPAGSTTLTARVRSNFAGAVITPAAAERR